jgi:hypothetical protein
MLCAIESGTFYLLTNFLIMKKRTKNIFIVGILIVAALYFRSCACQRKKENEKPVVQRNATLLTSPPIPEMDIPFQKFEIDPSQPNVLYSKYGAKINIPSNAFLDENGTVIKEKVVLSFREFYNPLDFYLAGIPMEYQDGGVEKVFESGGMVELNASSNQKALFVNPANKIKVDLYSWTKSKDFNLYDLDKSTGKWIEKGKDSISSGKATSDFNALPPIPPLPKIATPFAFKIQDDTNQYPELKEYENVLFDPVDPSKCKMSDAPEMSVKPLSNGLFEVSASLKLSKINIENKCKCYLAFEKGKNYKAALKTYQKKYSRLLKEREEARKKIKKQWDDYYAVVNQYRKYDVKRLTGEEKIIRSLTINNFGFVNCDQPIDYPKGGKVDPIYVDEHDNPISLSNVVLVEKNTNALFRYMSTIRYNPKADNLLWGITTDKKIAYFKNEDFKKLIAVNGKQKLQMHVYKGKWNSYEAIMKLLF